MLAEQVGLAVSVARGLLSDSRKLAIAEEKTAVVASCPMALSAVSAALGHVQPAADVARRLGVDYTLTTWRAPGVGRGSGKKPWSTARPTRAARVKKAAKRAIRIKRLFRGRHPRLTVAGVLPVALYGAEHDVWSASEIQRVRNLALAGFGLSAPGVPVALGAWGLPWDKDPKFMILSAPLLIWAREIWLLSGEATARSADTLTGIEANTIFKAAREPPRRAL